MSLRVLVVGSTGLIGGAVVAALEERGHDVIRASRSADERVDLRDPSSIDALYARVGELDAVVSATGSVPFKPVPELTVDDYRSGLVDKTLGQIALVVAGAGRVRGSFTVTSGILADQPVATGAAASVANGALNSFVIAASTGLPGIGGGHARVRLNAVSPNVLEDAPAYHDSFPGFAPVATDDVVRAYVRSVEGVETGQVFSV